MKRLWIVLILFVMVIFFGCSINKAITHVEKNQELAEFLNNTNLIYSNDKYWIKDVPEPETALGSVYEKITKTIKVKDGEKEFSAFRFTSGRLFGDIAETNINKLPTLFSTQYSYNAHDSANLAVLAVFTGNIDNVIQVEKKLELKEVWQPNLSNVTADSSYCDNKYYWVSRIWLGATSDVGLQEAKYRMEVAAVDFGGALSGLEKTSLHNVKQGVIAFNLEPVTSLSICKAPVGGEDTPKFITIRPKTLDELEKELRMQGFNEVK